MSGREYVGAARIDGPLVFVRGTHPVGYRELVECVDADGNTRLGMVLDTSDDVVVVQVFEGTDGLTMPVITSYSIHYTKLYESAK